MSSGTGLWHLGMAFCIWTYIYKRFHAAPLPKQFTSFTEIAVPLDAPWNPECTSKSFALLRARSISGYFLSKRSPWKLVSKPPLPRKLLEQAPPLRPARPARPPGPLGLSEILEILEKSKISQTSQSSQGAPPPPPPPRTHQHRKGVVGRGLG